MKIIFSEKNLKCENIRITVILFVMSILFAISIGTFNTVIYDNSIRTVEFYSIFSIGAIRVGVLIKQMINIKIKQMSLQRMNQQIITNPSLPL